MRRSRSSFDINGAVEKAAALTPTPPDAKPKREDPYEGVALVSFDAPPTAAPPEVGAPPAVAPTPFEEEETGDPGEAKTDPNLDETANAPASLPPVVVREIQPPSDPTPMPATPPVQPGEEATAELPRVIVQGHISASPTAAPTAPDLSGVSSEGARCERVVQWMRETLQASEVFLADDQGLPVAGLTSQEVRAAGTGGVAHAVRRLAVGVPGQGEEFEAQLVLGEPGQQSVFQMIGFAARGRRFIVALMRETALSTPVIGSVRHAFRQALFDTTT